MAMKRMAVHACGGQCGEQLHFDFSMAFQPIVDLRQDQVWGYEALVRGPQGECAASVLHQVDAAGRYAFDQACRARAISLAAKLGLSEKCLSINFLPNAVYEAATCIRATLAAAKRYQFPTRNIMFEVTECEQVGDKAHLTAIFEEYCRQGFLTAIDDFGAGYSGLNLLAEFRLSVIKIDMHLIRGIDADYGRQVIVRGIVGVCEDLGILPIAEGVETNGEASTLAGMGINIQQGFLYARPGFEQLPPATFPRERLAVTELAGPIRRTGASPDMQLA